MHHITRNKGFIRQNLTRSLKISYAIKAIQNVNTILLTLRGGHAPYNMEQGIRRTDDGLGLAIQAELSFNPIFLKVRGGQLNVHKTGFFTGLIFMQMLCIGQCFIYMYEG